MNEKRKIRRKLGKNREKYMRLQKKYNKRRLINKKIKLLKIEK